MWFPLTAVAALAYRLAIPDVTLGPLLSAHEAGTGGFLRHSHRASLSIHIAGSHTTPIATHILATLLKRLALLLERTHL